MSSIDELTSGTKIQTGALHPTDRYAKIVKITLNNLKELRDHVTVSGLGTSIDNISYGYSCTLTAN